MLITNFDSEISAEVADRLLRAGASIVVTGFRAEEILSERFKGRQGITYTDIDEVTRENITELSSRIQQDHGGLDVVFANNIVNAKLDADSIFQKQATAFSFALLKLHSLLRDGGAVVVCASFSPELRQKSELLMDTATAYMKSYVQYLALTLHARRIRANVVSLYKLNPDLALESEKLNWSLGRVPSTVLALPNSVHQIASVAVDLAVGDSSVNGAEVSVVDGERKLIQLSPTSESNVLGSPARVVDNVIFLASEVSRPLTGMELFPEGEIRKL